MVDSADILVAFWNGKREAGTYACLRYALTKSRSSRQARGRHLCLPALRPHEEQIVIATGIATKSFTLAAPSSGQKTLWVVIKPDGSIEETPEAEARASPCCGK